MKDKYKQEVKRKSHYKNHQNDENFFDGVHSTGVVTLSIRGGQRHFRRQAELAKRKRRECNSYEG